MDPDSCVLPFPNYRSKPPIPRCKPPPPPPLFWIPPPLFWLYNSLFQPLPSSQTPLFWLLPPCSLAQIPPLFWIPPYPFCFERPVQVCTLVLLRDPHIFKPFPVPFSPCKNCPPCWFAPYNANLLAQVVAVFPQFQDALNFFCPYSVICERFTYIVLCHCRWSSIMLQPSKDDRWIWIWTKYIVQTEQQMMF